jgi:short-subunit dehydrogenase
MHVDGAVAIVTGASSGIGRATAIELARRGAVVVGVARDAAALADVDRATGGSHVVADVRDPCHATGVVDTTLARHGRVDVVVANAGVGHAGAFADMAPDRVRELVDVNVLAPILLVRAALPHLLARRSGAVVLVSSIAGEVIVPGETVYSATKAASGAFAEALHEELRGSGVTVSAVSPGAVDTSFFDRRGMPYERTFPRPVPPQRVAVAIADAVTTGASRRLEPRWLRLPAALHRMAPTAYRALARRLA